MSSDARLSEPLRSSSSASQLDPISRDEGGITLRFEPLEIPSLESGTLDDLVLRPNKYFHPRRRPSFTVGEARIEYEQPARAVDRNLRLAEILRVLDGVIAAQRTRLTEQPLVLYPGVEAFALDARDRLRVVLINCWPKAEEQKSELQRSTSAFLSLLEEHCPSGARRLRLTGEHPLTLLHLRELLQRSPVRAIMRRVLLVMLLAVGLVTGLALRGPAEIREPLQAFFKGHWAQLSARLEPYLRETPVRLYISIDESAIGEGERLSFEAIEAALNEGLGVGRYRIGAYPTAGLTDASMLAAQWRRLCAERSCPARGWVVEAPRSVADLREPIRLLEEITEAPIQSEVVTLAEEQQGAQPPPTAADPADPPAAPPRER